jgi:hypothetical protein
MLSPPLPTHFARDCQKKEKSLPHLRQGRGVCCSCVGRRAHSRASALPVCVCARALTRLQLGVLDAKLGGLIKEQLGVPCVYNASVLTLIRGVRSQVRFPRSPRLRVSMPVPLAHACVHCPCLSVIGFLYELSRVMGSVCACVCSPTCAFVAPPWLACGPCSFVLRLFFVRVQLTHLVDGLDQDQLNAMVLGLGHSLVRCPFVAPCALVSVRHRYRAPSRHACSGVSPCVSVFSVAFLAGLIRA